MASPRQAEEAAAAALQSLRVIDPSIRDEVIRLRSARPLSDQRYTQLYADWTPEHGVSLSPIDTVCTMKLSEDKTVAVGSFSYRMALASHGVSSGCFFFEVLRVTPEGNTRVGWASRAASVFHPCGFDTQGFAIRDTGGTAFHRAHGYDYGRAHGFGDVVGCLIRISEHVSLQQDATGRSRKRKLDAAGADADAAAAPAKAGGRSRREIVAQVEQEQHELQSLHDISPLNPSHLRLPPHSSADLTKPHFKSEIHFFINGVHQGIAFANFATNAVIYPAISLYNNACVRVNFGPAFAFPPRISGAEVGYSPVSALFDPAASMDSLGFGLAGLLRQQVRERAVEATQRRIRRADGEDEAAESKEGVVTESPSVTLSPAQPAEAVDLVTESLTVTLSPIQPGAPTAQNAFPPL